MTSRASRQGCHRFVRHATTVACFAVLAGGCAFENEDILPPEEELGRDQSEVTLALADVDNAVVWANEGATVNGRIGTWKRGGHEDANTQGDCTGKDTLNVAATPLGCKTCTYGWCGFFPIGQCSTWKSGDKGAGYSYGMCNSTSFGERFAGYLWGTNRANVNYKLNASGTTTFGYHPYWCIKYKDGRVRNYQGWSYTNNCGSSYGYEVAQNTGTEDPLVTAVNMTGVGGSAGTYTNASTYPVSVPANAKNVTVTITGSSGDGDLYVRWDSAPTDSAYTCRPYQDGSNETCSLGQNGASARNLYARVKHYSATSGITFKITYNSTASQCTSGDCCDLTNNTFKANGVQCRASTGVCDQAESCTGTSADCPADGFEPSTKVCANPTDVCDKADMCNGAGSCVDGGKEPSTTSCRAQNGACDVTDYCNGGAACPSDAKAASGTLCNGGTCNGSGVCVGTVPAGWTCADTEYNDGNVDCGCGVADSISATSYPLVQHCASGTACGYGDTACTAGARTLWNTTISSISAGTWSRWYDLLPAKAKEYVVETGGTGTGDADLYVYKSGSNNYCSTYPTTSTYHCRSWGSTNTERCNSYGTQVVNETTAKYWCIGIYGYKTSTNVVFKTSWWPEQ